MSIKLKGSSDGSVSFDAPADTSPSGSDITLVLPTTVGSAEQFLKNSGTAGTLEFSSMVETSTGVGIGTSSPGEKLTVAGKVQATTEFKSESGNDLRLNAGSANRDVFMQVNGSTLMTVQGSTGRVGIGTGSPANILHLSSTGTPTIQITDADNSGIVKIENGSGSLFLNADTGNTVSNSRIQFGIDGSERLRIDSSGNVGVGTSSPDGTFSVSNNTEGSVYFKANSGDGVTDRGLEIKSGTGLYTGSKHIFDAKSSGGQLEFRTAGTPALFINQSQQVGIGTTSPGYKLDVAADGLNISVSNSTGNSRGVFQTDGDGFGLRSTYNNNGFITFKTVTGGAEAERARIDNSGRLLVGTTTEGPSTADDLTIATSGNTGISIRSGTSSAGNIFFSDGTSGDDEIRGVIQYDHAGNYMRLYTNSAEQLRIDSVGRLMVGTSSGDGKLIVRQSQNTTTTGTFTNPHVKITCLGTTNNTGFTGIAYAVSTVDNYGWTVGTQRVSTSGSDGAFVFRHHNNSATGNERMRILHNGEIESDATYANTTAGAANVHITSSGFFARSTSSEKYKTSIETLEDSYADAILDIRPVWYRSTCEKDNSEHGWWGFIAEEVAAVDPRLVHWKTVEVSHDEDGKAVKTPCDPEPEGVAYDRFVPHLLNLIKRQQSAIETLETKVAALEAQ